MVFPKISVTYIASALTALTGAGVAAGALNPTNSGTQGLLLALLGLFAYAFKRMHVRNLEQAELSHLAGAGAANAILALQDTLLNAALTKAGVAGPSPVNDVGTLINTLATAYQQYPLNHMQALITAGKAAADAVALINATPVPVPSPVLAAAQVEAPVAQPAPFQAAA